VVVTRIVKVEVVLVVVVVVGHSVSDSVFRYSRSGCSNRSRWWCQDVAANLIDAPFECGLASGGCGSDLEDAAGGTGGKRDCQEWWCTLHAQCTT